MNTIKIPRVNAADKVEVKIIKGESSFWPDTKDLYFKEQTIEGVKIPKGAFLKVPHDHCPFADITFTSVLMSGYYLNKILRTYYLQSLRS